MQQQQRQQFSYTSAATDTQVGWFLSDLMEFSAQNKTCRTFREVEYSEDIYTIQPYSKLEQAQIHLYNISCFL